MMTVSHGVAMVQIDTFSLRILLQNHQFDSWNCCDPKWCIFFQNSYAISSFCLMQLQWFKMIRWYVFFKNSYTKSSPESLSCNGANRYIFFTNSYTKSSLWIIELHWSKPIRFLYKIVTLKHGGTMVEINEFSDPREGGEGPIIRIKQIMVCCAILTQTHVHTAQWLPERLAQRCVWMRKHARTEEMVAKTTVKPK